MIDVGTAALLCVVGVLTIIGGRNLLRRGRGGPMTQQGGMAVVVGLGLIIYSIGSIFQVAFGLSLSAAVAVGVGTLFVVWLMLLVLLSIRRRRTQRNPIRRTDQGFEQQLQYRNWRQFVDDTTPQGFEEFTGWVFEQQGYRVQHTGQTGDEGIDLFLERDGLTCIVQCKRYGDKSIGVGALRDFYGAMVSRGVDYGFFVCTSSYTKPARTFAQAKALTLWDRADLEPWVLRHGQRRPPPIQIAPSEKRCGYCDSLNAPQARFCKTCGAPF